MPKFIDLGPNWNKQVSEKALDFPILLTVNSQPAAAGVTAGWAGVIKFYFPDKPAELYLSKTFPTQIEAKKCIDEAAAALSV